MCDEDTTRVNVGSTIVGRSSSVGGLSTVRPRVTGALTIRCLMDLDGQTMPGEKNPRGYRTVCSACSSGLTLVGLQPTLEQCVRALLDRLRAQECRHSPFDGSMTGSPFLGFDSCIRCSTGAAAILSCLASAAKDEVRALYDFEFALAIVVISTDRICNRFRLESMPS